MFGKTLEMAACGIIKKPGMSTVSGTVEPGIIRSAGGRSC